MTEDPERDTPEVLRSWLDRFDPEFVGLIGGNDATEHALQELYLPQSTRVPTPATSVHHPDDGHAHPEEYGVDHAGMVYAFGPHEATVLYTGGTTSAQYAEDLARLGEAN